MEKLPKNLLVLSVESRSGLYVAHRIDDDMQWGVGDIQPLPEFAGEADQRALLSAVLDSLTEVSQDEKPYSLCTDGRRPVKLADGTPVPVREQQVGTDTMVFFHMAESLGRQFYKDPYAPVSRRINEVAEFMYDNGIMPSTHRVCGAAGGYPVINMNLPVFGENPLYVARQRLLLPGTVEYDATVRTDLNRGYRDRQERGLYDGWNDLMVTDAVMRVSGPRAIAELLDDGRGKAGHVEELIVRNRLDGVAIDEAKVFERVGGREVFGNNDARTEHNARLIGWRNPDDFKIALMAAEDFTDGSHGTLARNLPTYIIEKAA